MEKSILQDLIAKGYYRKQMAVELGVHVNTIYYWMLKHKLQTAPKKLCKKCGTDDENHFDPDRHNICRSCRHKRCRVKKEKAVEYMGGKCCKCGYKKCFAALDFHHIDPEQKEHQWNTLRFQSWDKIVEELKKCILVCKNCHTEIHWELNNENR